MTQWYQLRVNRRNRKFYRSALSKYAVYGKAVLSHQPELDAPKETRRRGLAVSSCLYSNWPLPAVSTVDAS